MCSPGHSVDPESLQHDAMTSRYSSIRETGRQIWPASLPAASEHVSSSPCGAAERLATLQEATMLLQMMGLHAPSTLAAAVIRQGSAAIVQDLTWRPPQQ